MLVRDSLWRELKRQTFFGAGADPLLAPLRAALDDPPAEGPRAHIPPERWDDPARADDEWE